MLLCSGFSLCYYVAMLLSRVKLLRDAVCCYALLCCYVVKLFVYYVVVLCGDVVLFYFVGLCNDVMLL